MELSPEAAARLQNLRTGLIVKVGEVLWLPAKHVRFFPGGKDRFCLVAGVEQTAGNTPSLIHMVAGSTKAAQGATTLRIEAGEGNLNETTFFKFRFNGTVTADDVMSDGQWRGSLAATRLPEIEAAIKASNSSALKKVWSL